MGTEEGGGGNWEWRVEPGNGGAGPKNGGWVLRVGGDGVWEWVGRGSGVRVGSGSVCVFSPATLWDPGIEVRVSRPAISRLTLLR